MKATKKALIGRKIVDVDLRPFDNGRGGTAYNAAHRTRQRQRIAF